MDRKESWYILMYYPNIFLEGVEECHTFWIEHIKKSAFWQDLPINYNILTQKEKFMKTS